MLYAIEHNIFTCTCNPWFQNVIEYWVLCYRSNKPKCLNDVRRHRWCSSHARLPGQRHAVLGDIGDLRFGWWAWKLILIMVFYDHHSAWFWREEPLSLMKTVLDRWSNIFLSLFTVYKIHVLITTSCTFDFQESTPWCFTAGAGSHARVDPRVWELANRRIHVYSWKINTHAQRALTHTT